MQILFISNRDHIRELFEQHFADSNFQFIFSSSEDNALLLLEKETIQFIIVDIVYNLSLPRPISDLASFFSELPVVPARIPALILGDGRPPCSSQREALQIGAQEYILLPESSEQIVDAVCQLSDQPAAHGHLPFMVPAKAEPPPPEMGVRSITAARTTMELEKKLLDHLRAELKEDTSTQEAHKTADTAPSILEHEIHESDVMLSHQDPSPAPTIPPTDVVSAKEPRNQLRELSTDMIRSLDHDLPPSSQDTEQMDEIEELLSEGFLDLDISELPPFPERAGTQELLNVVEAIEIPSTQELVDHVMLDAALDDADSKISALQQESGPPEQAEPPSIRKVDSAGWEKRQQKEALAHAAEKRIEEEMETQAEFEQALHDEEMRAREMLQEMLVQEEENARKDLHNKLVEEEERARQELEDQLREKEIAYKEQQEEELRLHIEKQRKQEEKKLAAHKERILEQLKSELQKEGENQKKQEEEKFEQHKKHVLMEMASELEQKEQEFLDRQKKAEVTLQKEFESRIQKQKQAQLKREKKASDLLAVRLKDMEETALSEMKSSFQEKLSNEEEKLHQILEQKRLDAIARIEEENRKSQERAQEQEKALSQKLALKEQKARKHLEATIKQDWGKYQEQKELLAEEKQKYQQLLQKMQQQQEELVQLENRLKADHVEQEKKRAALEEERSTLEKERSQHAEHWSFKSGLFAAVAEDAPDGSPLEHKEGAHREEEYREGEATHFDHSTGSHQGEARPIKPEGGAWSLEELEQTIPPPGPPLAAVPFNPLEGHFAEGELAALFFSAHQLQTTGCLDIRHSDGRQRTVFFERGEPVGFASKQRSDRPEEILFQRGLITHEKLLELQKGPLLSARRMCVQLVENNALKATELFSSIRMVLCNQVLSCLDFGAGQFLYREELSHLADRVRLQESFPTLLLQGIRLKMHEETLWRLLGGPSAVVSARTADTPIPPFSAEEQRVISLFNQPRSLEDLVTSAGIDPEITLRVIYTCLATNVISLLAKGLPQQSAQAVETDQSIDLSRIRERLNLARKSNYYDFLGVPIDASAFEIRQAISRLRSMFHPDAYPDPAFLSIKGQLDEIQEILDEAELVLGHANTREQYARIAKQSRPQGH